MAGGSIDDSTDGFDRRAGGGEGEEAEEEGEDEDDVRDSGRFTISDQISITETCSPHPLLRS